MVLMTTRRDDISKRRRPMLVGAMILGLAFALPSAFEARADSDDHERARAAHQSGEIISLREMLEEVESRFAGQVIKVDLESERRGDQRIWVYEIKLIEPDGNVIKLELDAKTKEILKMKGRAGPRITKP